jgi:hypothetical protein
MSIAMQTRKGEVGQDGGSAMLTSNDVVDFKCAGVESARYPAILAGATANPFCEKLVHSVL